MIASFIWTALAFLGWSVSLYVRAFFVSDQESLALVGRTLTGTANELSAWHLEFINFRVGVSGAALAVGLWSFTPLTPMVPIHALTLNDHAFNIATLLSVFLFANYGTYLSIRDLWRRRRALRNARARISGE